MLIWKPNNILNFKFVYGFNINKIRLGKEIIYGFNYNFNMVSKLLNLNKLLKN